MRKNQLRFKNFWLSDFSGDVATTLLVLKQTIQSFSDNNFMIIRPFWDRIELDIHEMNIPNRGVTISYTIAGAGENIQISYAVEELYFMSGASKASKLS